MILCCFILLLVLFSFEEDVLDTMEVESFKEQCVSSFTSTSLGASVLDDEKTEDEVDDTVVDTVSVGEDVNNNE